MSASKEEVRNGQVRVKEAVLKIAAKTFSKEEGAGQACAVYPGHPPQFVREAFKKTIESLNAVIPTLDSPSPLSLTPLGFFSFQEGLFFSLIGLLSQA